MAVSGLPETCDNHAKCIARLALDMMDMAKNVKMGPEPVVCFNHKDLFYTKPTKVSIYCFFICFI